MSATSSLPQQKPERSQSVFAPGNVHSPDKTDPTTISVHMDSHLDDPRRRYGMAQLLRCIGLRTSFENSSEPVIYIGSDITVGQKAALWIEADPGSFPLDAPPQTADIQDIPVLFRARPPAVLVHGNRVEFDLALATWYWLTLYHERYTARRDSHGRVPVSASLLSTSGWKNRPPVLRYAELVSHRLETRGVERKPIARWPFGARYAVALSHDVDLPERPSRGAALLKELILGKRSRRESYWALRAELKARGIYESLFAPASDRSEWNFPTICDLELRHGCRSAFYFAVVGRHEGHPCDITYDVTQRRYSDLFRRLTRGGWEVGLHAAYLTKSSRPEFKRQIHRLQARTPNAVQGVRHHFLQVDHADPTRSLLAHADSGLIYDTSIGFNDGPGFRAGTALPYQPYDPTRETCREFVEIPMSITDTYFPKRDRKAAADLVVRHLQTVRSLNGVGVLNWHVGHWDTDPGWHAGYEAACEFLSLDSGVWIATPAQIARWWLYGEIPDHAAAHSDGHPIGGITGRVRRKLGRILKPSQHSAQIDARTIPTEKRSRPRPDDLELRYWRPGDTEAINAMYNELDPRLRTETRLKGYEPRTTARWNWEFGSNKELCPDGPGYAVAFHHGRVVGIQAYIPIELQHNGRIIRSGKIEDILIHPDYRGMGVADDLAQLLIRRATQNDFSALWVFTSTAESLLGRNGFQTVAPFDVMQTCLSSTAPPAESDVVVRELGMPDERCDDFAAEFGRQIGGITEHLSSKFLRWRINDNPLAEYAAFAALDKGRVVGISAFKLDDHRKTGYVSELAVTAHASDSFKHLADGLLRPGLDLFQSRGYRHAEARPSGEHPYNLALRTALASHGFSEVATHNPAKLMVRPIGEGSTSMLDPSCWRLSELMREY
ncbi:MAG: GNAT family N-acetyltransferase [Phycisphaerales bacterium]|nr:GNAT family N-acetyltransferase [Phycisphaerales bacterium]